MPDKRNLDNFDQKKLPDACTYAPGIEDRLRVLHLNRTIYQAGEMSRFDVRVSNSRTAEFESRGPLI